MKLWCYWWMMLCVWIVVWWWCRFILVVNMNISWLKILFSWLMLEWKWECWLWLWLVWVKIWCVISVIFCLWFELLLKWGCKLLKFIMLKKVLNGLLLDVWYLLLLLVVKNYWSVRCWKCVGRLLIRVFLVWIWGVIFFSLIIWWWWWKLYRWWFIIMKWLIGYMNFIWVKNSNCGFKEKNYVCYIGWN